MKHCNKIYTWLVIALSSIILVNLTGCSDDIPAGTYYVKKGQMMSDYLSNHENFSQFKAIVEKAAQSTRGTNLMDLLSTRGQFTCFAPTNAAVDAYLAANGFQSVDQIPADLCDTIARTHLINNGTSLAYILADIEDFMSDPDDPSESRRGDIPKANMNDRYLSLIEVPYSYVDRDGKVVDNEPTIQLNESGIVLKELANDTVENGYVHPINGVLISSNKTVAALLAEEENLKLFAAALEVTGLNNLIATKIQDDTWNPDADIYEEYNGKRIYSGAQWNYCYVPQSRKFKFTVFACPDDILAQKYNITDLESMYNYARSIYGGPAYSATLDFKAKDNPLHRLVAYHCLPFAVTYDHYTSICTIRTNETASFVNPTEWYSTLDTLTTVKMTRLMSAKEIATYGGVSGDLYLNRSDNNRSNAHWTGVHVNRQSKEARNGTFFIVDGLIDYGEETKNEIFNTRIRFDMIDCFPEMLSNDLRNYEETHTTTSSEDPDSPARNYILPNGYLDDVKVNSDGFFLYQGARNSYWSYEGDEFNLCSDKNTYDIEFYLPSVPSGTYQIRLGFADMDTRGICQFYLDDVSQGIPFDERSNNFERRTGYVSLNTLESYDEERREATKKNMHNLGWYHGPKAAFSVSGTGHKDGREALMQGGTKFCDNPRTVRYVLCTADLDENIRHKIRIKSVWAVGNALVMMDYFELVPKSVYGVEGEGKAEDDY